MKTRELIETVNEARKLVEEIEKGNEISRSTVKTVVKNLIKIIEETEAN